jgi:hypothetical protein
MTNMGIQSGVRVDNTTAPKIATASYGKFGQRGTPLQKQLYSQFSQPMQTNDMRAMAQGNANYNLGAQTARATSGLQWGGQGQQQYMQNVNHQNAQRNLGTSLLEALLGGYS